MNRLKTWYLLPAFILVVAGVVLGMNINAVVSNTDTMEQLRKLEDAFIVINRQYVEDVKPGMMAESAIRGMLEKLDPHSSYISAEEIAAVQEGYQGSFGGVGIWFEVVDDTARVTSTVDDGPSEKAGVMAGDRIVGIDDSSAIGLNSNGIQKRLKGPVGTGVKMNVYRRGVKKPIDFSITRGRIPLYSISSAYMVDEQTGYIRIGRFAMTTHQEFRDQLRRLKGEGMQRLILDLRNNPGGIKGTAVGVADELLSGGKSIVNTWGRNTQENEQDMSRDGGLFESPPVIVLVNANSASGSEIVAGALQDQDRALIVGQRTFGKALVQRQFPLRDGSVLQLTVSRYFTPSGRLIQTPYEQGDYEDYYKDKFSTLREATYSPAHYLEQLPDSLKFKTTHGRTVFGGGGIMPDYIVAIDTTALISAPLVQAIVRPGIESFFIRDWYEKHEHQLVATWGDRQQAFRDQFTVDAELWKAFWAYAKEQGVKIDSKAAEGEVHFTSADVAVSRTTLETILKARLAQRLYNSEAWFPIYNQIDPVFNEAVRLWDHAEKLAVYHTAH